MIATEERCPRIKPEDYSDFIQQIEITDISLVSANFGKLGNAERPASCLIEVKSKASYENAEGEFKILQHYDMRVKDAETKQQVAKLKAVFAVTYRSKSPMTEDIFDLFERHNLPVNTWPYFREFAQNSFTRMNWPQMVAPVFRAGKRSRETRAKA